MFTPTGLVRDIVDLVPNGEAASLDATCLDPACGHGQFLLDLLRRKLEAAARAAASEAPSDEPRPGNADDRGPDEHDLAAISSQYANPAQRWLPLPEPPLSPAEHSTPHEALESAPGSLDDRAPRAAGAGAVVSADDRGHAEADRSAAGCADDRAHYELGRTTAGSTDGRAQDHADQRAPNLPDTAGPSHPNAAQGRLLGPEGSQHRAERYRHTALTALSRIYGVDIDGENVRDARRRLLASLLDAHEATLGEAAPPEYERAARAILQRTVICADFLHDDFRITEFRPDFGVGEFALTTSWFSRQLGPDDPRAGNLLAAGETTEGPLHWRGFGDLPDADPERR